MRLVLALVALAAVVVAHAPANVADSISHAAPQTVDEARAHLAAMSTGDRARFMQRCKRRQDNAGAEQAPAAPAAADESKPIGAQPVRNPENSLRTWTDVISGPYHEGGPAVDMCVLAVTERAVHNGMVDVLNAEATTASAAIQELSKNRVTTDGVDLTAVTERRPKGTAKLGVEPGGSFKAHPPNGNPPFVKGVEPASEPEAEAAAAAEAAPASLLQATATQDAPLSDTSHYGIIHSYVEDMDVLQKELAECGAKAQKLRMMIVEKDGFLGGLQKREKLLRVDMTGSKRTLAALAAHIQAVEARIGRLKQERQLSEIAAQKHQFDSASAKLNVELGGIRAVSSALNDRIKFLGTGVSANMAAEIEAMRRSLQPAVAAGLRPDEGAAAAIAEATGGQVTETSLLQDAATPALRGSKRE